MREYQDGSQEEYWGEKEIAELRELNVAAFREIAYLKNQKESLRELNDELLKDLEAVRFLAQHKETNKRDLIDICDAAIAKAEGG